MCGVLSKLSSAVTVECARHVNNITSICYVRVICLLYLIFSYGFVPKCECTYKDIYFQVCFY